MQSQESDYYDFPSDWPSSQLTDQIASLRYIERRQLNWTRIRPRIARHLYRYFAINPSNPKSVKQLEDVLLDSRFWLASPADFNDPFDSKAHVIYEANPNVRRIKFDKLLRNFEPQLSGLERKRKVHLMMGSKSPQEWHRTTAETIARHVESLGVICFSTDPRSLLMWSHYANNHMGICLQFEALRDIRTFSLALPVRYTNDYPTLNFFTYTGNELANLMLSKFKRWEYENEHRIVAIGAAHKWFRFAPPALTGIILGSKIDDARETKIRSILQARSSFGLPSVKLYKAMQHGSSYKLVIEKA